MSGIPLTREGEYAKHIREMSTMELGNAIVDLGASMSDPRRSKLGLLVLELVDRARRGEIKRRRSIQA